MADTTPTKESAIAARFLTLDTTDDARLDADIASLDERLRSRLLESLKQHERTSQHRDILGTVRRILDEQLPGHSAIGVLFGTVEWSTGEGFFVHPIGTVLTEDGTTTRLDLDDDLDNLLVTSFGCVPQRYTIAVDLHDSRIEECVDKSELDIKRRFPTPASTD